MRYTLGLDIGIASIGTAVINLDKRRIEYLGVRTFPEAEGEKGKPINAERREARGRRRTTRRKAIRMKKVKELFIKYNLVNEEDLTILYNNNNFNNPWKKRVEGLDRILSGKEFAIVLTHLAKRRGFKSNSKINTLSEDAKEGQKIKLAISENNKIMIENNYRTLGEMFYNYEKFKCQKRNRQDNKGKKVYKSTVSRAGIKQEIKKIFKAQRDLGNKLANEEFEKEYLDIVLFQLHYSTEELMLKMIGKCRFENEKRAPKASITCQIAELYQKINNTTIKNYSKGSRKLTDQERNIVFNECLKRDKTTYKQLRKSLSLEDDDRFAQLRYSSKKDVESKSNFINLEGYNKVFKALENKELIYDWNVIDEIVYLITIIKDDAKLKERLNQLNVLSEKEIERLSELNFTKFSHLSIKALRNIIPYLKLGQTYTEACISAGYNVNSKEKQKLLPNIDNSISTNPVVIRALSKSRKVINEIIRKYGSPTSIHIELVRELKKDKKERDKITKMMEERRGDKEKLREKLKNELNIENISSKVFDKYRLAMEQDFKCIYSSNFTGETLDKFRIINDPTYCQIDHIIPYSISYDDSWSNKVVVFTSENQNKRNRTPYEYLKSIGRNIANYEAFIKSLSGINEQKKSNLLKHHITEGDKEEFKSRNLNDTSYIAKELKKFIQDNLIINNEEGIEPIVVVPGRLTATMRYRWGLTKNRQDNELHHAIDACVIAAIDRKIINRISNYSKANEIKYIKDSTGLDEVKAKEIEEKFPIPWIAFSDEIKARLSKNPKESLEKIKLSSYDEEFMKNNRNFQYPIIVSREAKQKLKGEFHKATVQSLKNLDYKKFYIKVDVPLTGLTLEFLENMCDKEKNQDLYYCLKEQLHNYNNNPKVAFKNKFSYFNTNTKKFKVVDSIKVWFKPVNKVFIRGGISDIGECIRVDVYKKKDRFYFRSVYGIDIVNKKLSHIAKGKNWVYLTDEYEFLFSLYKDNLVEVEYDDGMRLLAYMKFFRNDGRLVLKDTLSSKEVGSKVVGKIKSIKKYYINVLGEYNEIKKEKIIDNYGRKKGRR